MKNLYCVVLLSIFMSILFCEGTQPNGEGTESNPYRIQTLDHLRWLCTNSSEWDMVYRLDNDINAMGCANWSQNGFIPIGNDNTPFTGQFHGNHKTISNLYMRRPNQEGCGMFGQTEYALIQKLFLENIDIEAQAVVGGLIGAAYQTEVNNCYVSGRIEATHQSANMNSYIGGLIGRTTSFVNAATLLFCGADVDITADGDCVGGLTGMMMAGYGGNPGGNNLIANCFARGSISAREKVGGLVGFMRGTNGFNSIQKCYAASHVTGTSTTGGLVGQRDLGNVTNSIWDIDTSGQTSSDGGTGKTFYEMQDYMTYQDIGFDWCMEDDYWAMHPAVNGGYPYLATLYPHNVSYHHDPACRPPGSGTSEDPYQIRHANHLYRMSVDPVMWDSHILIYRDIDFSISAEYHEGKGFLPIGTSNDRFSGYVHGDNKTISGLTINRSGETVIGLFAYTIGSTIEDLRLADVDIVSKSHVGAFSGDGYNATLINCSASGSITSTVTSGYSYAGGLVGVNQGTSSHASEIVDCFADIDITATEAYVGGLIGANKSGTNYLDGGNMHIYRSASNGAMSGGSYVGGIIGKVEVWRHGNVAIDNCYATGEIVGSNSSAGLVGEIETDASSTVTIEKCYAAGNVDCISSAGGLIGYNDAGSVTNSYWDTESTGQSSSAGGTGLNTAAMQSFFTFYDAGWDFINEPANGTDEIWGMNDADNGGYPFLSCQGYENGWPGLPDGDGSEANPWQIESLGNLLWISFHPDTFDDYYVQTADIDATGTQNWFDGEGFLPIGNNNQRFTGTYNGDGYQISNLHIDRPDQRYIGLFGFTAAATIDDVHLTNVSIHGQSAVGALIGGKRNGDVGSCSATGTLTVEQDSGGNSYTGGLIGRNEAFESISSNIIECFADVDITATGDFVGGLTGNNRAGYPGYEGGTILIENCYAQGDVSGDEKTGGFIGNQDGTASGTIEVNHCYSSGAVTGTGGLIGTCTHGTVNSSFWDTETSGQGSSAGGTGLTTAEMQNFFTYMDSGWDFMGESLNGTENYWGLNSEENGGYPFLAWQGYENQPFEQPNGDGSASTPWEIASFSNLKWMSSNSTVWNDHFVQTDDIVAYSTRDTLGISPIGSESNPFSGDYDGGGHTITGVVINKPNREYVGLFAYAQNANLEDIHLVDADVTGYRKAGGLVGMCKNTDIHNCSTTGSVTVPHNYAGGLIGEIYATENHECNITSCFADMETSAANNYAGGLAALLTSGLLFNEGGDILISDCYSKGSVTAPEYTGGLIGCMPESSVDCGTVLVTNSFSATEVNGSSHRGGLIADRDYGYVVSSFWDTEVSGMSSSDGGTGLTTAEMQNPQTYLDAGWDIMDETENGTDDIWGFNPDENGGYPFLAWQGYENESQSYIPGSGTTEDPYLIRNMTQLNRITTDNTFWDKVFLQTCDITMTSTRDSMGFLPIGNESTPFSGVYDGGGFQIANLMINRPATHNIGLFSVIENAEISNLTLSGVTITGANQTGSLVGQAISSTLIECHVSGTINAGDGLDETNAGGLVGLVKSYEPSTISHCTADINLTAAEHAAGGLIGCINGFNEDDNVTTIMDCSTTGVINGLGDIGGVAGFVSIYYGGTASFDNCWSTCQVTGSDVRTGGFAGLVESLSSSSITISNCWSEGSVTGNELTGSFFGHVSCYYHSTISIQKCHAQGTVNGYRYIGGFGGYTRSSDNGSLEISDCYAQGEVASTYAQSGFIAICATSDLSTNITNCYAACSGDFSVASDGFILQNDGATVTNCYWDTELSGISTSDGGTGLTTAEMQDFNSYFNAGWDFMDETQNGTDDIWGINPEENGGYPFLAWQGYEHVYEWAPEGSGTEASPYQIENLADLVWLSEHSAEWDKHFVQVADIDATETQNWYDGAGFLPIGNGTYQFTGCYDGAGYAIEGLTINRSNKTYAGLFGYTRFAEISNIHLENANIFAKKYIGAIIGKARSCNVTQCSATGTVDGNEATQTHIGGLIGYCYREDGDPGIQIIECCTNISASASGRFCGGLIGLISIYVNDDIGVTISNCSAQGSVSAFMLYAGLVGSAYSSMGGLMLVENCYSSCYIEQNNQEAWGGLIADCNYCVVNNCFWDVEASGVSNSVGGIGLTTTEMHNPQTYLDAGWDFLDESQNGTNDIWGINPQENGGYPFLAGQGYENKPQAFFPGSGTIEAPYLISNMAQLNRISSDNTIWDKHFAQVADIDATDTQNWFDGAGFLPIGNNNQRFTGTYNGDGYQISNLYIDRPDQRYVGLFGFTAAATIDDVHLTNVSIHGQSAVGALIGSKRNGDVSRCSATGTLTAEHDSGGKSLAGGLIGRNEAFESISSNIIECFTDVDITATGDIVGGLTGNNRAGYPGYDGGTILIENCYAQGDVSGDEKTGGFIGNQDGTDSGTIEVNHCYSSGAVTGTGGLIGSCTHGIINSSFWDTETSGQGSSAGGTGLTTAEMQDYSTYFNAGWDFMDETQNGTNDIWGINPDDNGGYPFLAWQGYENNPPSPPDAPQDVVLTTDSTSVTITWSPVAGATSYKVFSCATPDGEFAEDTSGTFENESWTVLMPRGGRYYYVKAVLEYVRQNETLQRTDSRARKQ